MEDRQIPHVAADIFISIFSNGVNSQDDGVICLWTGLLSGLPHKYGTHVSSTAAVLMWLG